MTTAVTWRAPTRIDFGGGWTDVPPYPERDGGFVCNLAIARYARATVSGTRSGDAPSTRAGEGALAEAAMRRAGVRDAVIHLESDFPVGAGLGGSSAASVATIAAIADWRGHRLGRAELAEESRELETTELHIAGGRQDHYAAAFGGALALTFGSEVDVEPIPLSHDFRTAIERRCILAYTGQSRISGDTITAVLHDYEQREPGVLGALRYMAELAREMAAALRAEDLDALGRLVGEHWVHQRALHPSIPTPLIDEVLARARAAGAIGGKALGASGGGCVLVIAAEDREDDVRSTVAALAEPLPFTIDLQGAAPCP